MTFDEWAESVPDAIRTDVLWKVEAYRLALFLADLAWADTSKLAKDRRTIGIADQLFRATGKISSNIGEGYSRGTGKDRSRFYDYAIGSTRESRDWYFNARHLLGEKVSSHRTDLCMQILKLTMTMAKNERRANKRFDS